VQHALRAFTARDRKELRQAAQTYRDNPRFSIEDAIREVGVGEAVTSLLGPKGAPGMAERTMVRPPSSHLGAVTPEVRAKAIAASPLAGKYETLLDRESAFEMLKARAEKAAQAAEEEDLRAARRDEPPEAREFRAARRYSPGGAQARAVHSHRAGTGTSFSGEVAKVVIKELKGTTGRRIVRGILGTLFKAR
jgi:hypothetical protein